MTTQFLVVLLSVLYFQKCPFKSQTYSIGNGRDLASKVESDYTHAHAFLKSNKDEHCRVGTLSKSEWEAVCMLLITNLTCAHLFSNHLMLFFFVSIVSGLHFPKRVS